MPFLVITNNLRILETFIVIPSLGLNQSRMTHKAVGGGVENHSPSPRWIVNSQASPTWNKLVFCQQMLAMHANIFCYYQDWHEKPDRSLGSRLSSFVDCMNISWSKGYWIPLPSRAWWALHTSVTLLIGYLLSEHKYIQFFFQGSVLSF